MSLAQLLDPNVWASLLTLSLLEVVLGIDNLVFIAITAGRLPPARRSLGRRLGLGLALLTRLGLLASIAWLIGLTRPLFEAFGRPVSWRDLILIGGGFFLLYKGTAEIHERIEGPPPKESRPSGKATLIGVVLQIMVLDIVFSLDSVVTAVGMASQLWVMMAAVVLAVMVMLVASDVVAGIIERRPTVKMLALSFLLLIGMTLVADGVGFHVPKGFIYAAIGFSIMVEAFNLLAQRRRSVAPPADTTPPSPESKP